MASLFTTIYFFAYSSQSPNIALLSCLLRTLGIVSYITLNIFSCLLRTLALSVHLGFTCNFAGVFCHVLPTYSVTGYGPRPLDASQASTLITMSISAPTLTKANNALLPASCSSQHHISSASPLQINASFDWNADSGATSHMTLIHIGFTTTLHFGLPFA
jgi:hypothetical protein